MSLYLNLRKYLEDENRDPKEPFLTNAVVDFLNRIPPQDELLSNVVDWPVMIRRPPLVRSRLTE